MRGGRDVGVSQWTAGCCDVLLQPILSAGDNTCVSSLLAPSANFTGRLKIKQGLPSLPVAKGNMCEWCVYVCSSTGVLLYWERKVHADVYVLKDKFLALCLHVILKHDFLLISVASYNKC